MSEGDDGLLEGLCDTRITRALERRLALGGPWSTGPLGSWFGALVRDPYSAAGQPLAIAMPLT